MIINFKRISLEEYFPYIQGLSRLKTLKTFALSKFSYILLYSFFGKK